MHHYTTFSHLFMQLIHFIDGCSSSSSRMVTKIRLLGQKHWCWLTDLTISIYPAEYAMFQKILHIKINLDNSLGRVGGEYSGVWQRQKVVHTTISF